MAGQIGPQGPQKDYMSTRGWQDPLKTKIDDPVRYTPSKFKISHVQPTTSIWKGNRDLSDMKYQEYKLPDIDPLTGKSRHQPRPKPARKPSPVPDDPTPPPPTPPPPTPPKVEDNTLPVVLAFDGRSVGSVKRMILLQQLVPL
ncbi:formin-1-like [Mya arenaria]|uniref:formin-1-like n=1 Tax=Mya arenaria TaxID=6604 RepID=UPI0022E96A4E|nr:formin-1-like [Mya arenaria]